MYFPSLFDGRETQRGICFSLARARAAVLQARRARDPQSDPRVNPGDPIVRHDAPAARQRLRLPRWKRLPDVKHSKKYKTQQQIFPVKHGMKGQGIARPMCRRDAPTDWQYTSQQECECCPETSSTTTNCGSLVRRKRCRPISRPHTDAGYKQRNREGRRSGVCGPHYIIVRGDVNIRRKEEKVIIRIDDAINWEGKHRTPSPRCLRHVAEAAGGRDEKREARLARRGGLALRS